MTNGDRFDRIENAITRIIEVQRNQLGINQGLQAQIAQLAERQAITDEQIRTTSAGLEQLERTVDYLMRRDQQN